MKIEDQHKIVELTVSIIKRRFPNLTTEETIKLAHEICFGVFSILSKEDHAKSN